jgi:hypothetical protein
VLNINHVSGANVEIINLLGQTVKSVNNISEYQRINISELEQGTYFVKVIVDGNSVNHKVIITK